MADSNTIRILSLDGGGVRGLISATFMELFVQKWGIDPKTLWQYFDVITGSSIGGISALGYAFGLSPSDLKAFFLNEAPWIFTTSTSTPSVQPSTLTKINTMIGGNSSFYPSTTPGIGVQRLYSKLLSVFGSKTLQDMKTAVLITSFEKSDVEPDFEKYTNTPVYFSNSKIIPILSGQNLDAVDACMATSAAPLYFPAWDILQPGDHEEYPDLYIDGGVVQNNPASYALAIGKALKPTANRYCVLSIGTGLGDVGFAPDTVSFKKEHKKQLALFRASPLLFAAQYNVPPGELERYKQLDALGIFDGAYLLMDLIDIMTTAPQECVSNELSTLANFTLDNLYYYRMQGYLDTSLNTDLDNSSPDILAYYQDFAIQSFNDDSEAISTFLGHLTA
jgi:predicted acylesterase/phospholipase RssA